MLKKIHDLSDLLIEAAEYDNQFTKLLPFARVLNQYITEGRYPGDLPFESIGKAEALEAIDAAGKIPYFVVSKIDLSEDISSHET